MMKRDSRDVRGDGPPSKMTKGDLSNVQLRFLIPGRAAGIIIGKGGENIKHIRSQYNAKLSIPDSRGPERIFTLEGDLKSCCEIVRELLAKLKDIMNAKLSDPKRIMGNPAPRRRGRKDEDDDHYEDEDDNLVDLRLLVHQSQAGSVIGRGGERIKDLRESAPPRGPRDNYDANNFVEASALSYGGWLSREAQRMLAQGIPLDGPHGMSSMGGGYPMMGGGPGMMMPPSHGMGGMNMMSSGGQMSSYMMGGDLSPGRNSGSRSSGSRGGGGRMPSSSRGGNRGGSSSRGGNSRISSSSGLSSRSGGGSGGSYSNNYDSGSYLGSSGDLASGSSQYGGYSGNGYNSGSYGSSVPPVQSADSYGTSMGSVDDRSAAWYGGWA